MGLLLPVPALTALVLGWSPVVQYALTARFRVGAFSTRWMR